MIPTQNLRYVIKQVLTPQYGPDTARDEKVLQQYWEEELTQEQMLTMTRRMEYRQGGEWRNVPTVADDGG